MDNSKNKNKGYVSLVDKELNYFKSNSTKVKHLEPISYRNDILVDTNKNVINNKLHQPYDNEVLISRSKFSNDYFLNQKNKKPVVTISSLPQDDPLPAKKPVLIIKRNVTNISEINEQPVVKKPVVSILSKKEYEKQKEQLNTNKTDYKDEKPFEIDFDAPPTQEQIRRSSVVINSKENNNPSWNKQVDNQIDKLNEKPRILFSNIQDNNQDQEKEHKRDFFHRPPTSSVVIKSNKQDEEDQPTNQLEMQQEKKEIFDKKESSDNSILIHEHNQNSKVVKTTKIDLNEIENVDEIELANKESSEIILPKPRKINQLENIVKSTSITPLIDNYNFDHLILDSIEKSVVTTLFKVKILKKLNMSINAGDVVLIYCPTDGGKTTLLNILSKRENFNKGEYLIYDSVHKELNESQTNDFIEKHLFYIQRAVSLNSQETIYWHLKNAYRKHFDEYGFEINLDQLIEKFNIGNFVNKTFNILNNIEKTIVLIVYSIVINSQIVLIDDPYLPDSHQDDYIIKNAIRMANTIYNKTIILTCNHKRLFDVANKVYSLVRGGVKLI